MVVWLPTKFWRCCRGIIVVAESVSFSELQQRILSKRQSFNLLLLILEIETSELLLQETASRSGIAYVNVSLELSRQLRQQIIIHPREVAQTLDKMVRTFPDQLLILDRLEVLFTPTLQLDVLRLLLDLGRSGRLIAIWPGEYQNTRLTYAMPGHPEYREYEQPEKNFPVTILTLRR